jgi:CBS domain-containing protein
MKVRDILKLKGNTLYSATPETQLTSAVRVMAEHDIGSLVVMKHAELVGILTFREVIGVLAHNHGSVDHITVGKVMDEHPLTCTPETDLDEVRRMMLNRHARYLPVLDKQVLMGVISFYDVAKSVVEAQGFENSMLKAYIRDWPEVEHK